MYNNLVSIKEKLETVIFNKFSKSIREDIAELIEKLTDKDTFINNNLMMNLQNILPLPEQDAKYFIKLALELTSSSGFAPVLLLEKIPTLLFYDLTHEVGTFLRNIKNYGARAVSLFLGSDLLKTEDLIDVLEQSTIPFYRAMLNSVNLRHQDLGVCSSIIMRFSAKIEAVIHVKDIDAYLDICLQIVKQFGVKISEQFISNAHDFLKYVPLEKCFSIIEYWADKSHGAAEFVVSFPDLISSFLIPTEKNAIEAEVDSLTTKMLKMEILKTESYAKALKNAHVLEDEDFSALLLTWPKAGTGVKANILFQLEKDNYKQYILNHSGIETVRDRINHVTNDNWFSSWMYCGTTIDLSYIRKRLGSLLQNPKHFSLEAKSIIKKHKSLFDRSNTIYDNARVLSMIQVAGSYCVDDGDMQELIALQDFLQGKPNTLKCLLSHSSLVIQVWERNPWVDYGKSDELYSCTGLGDYNFANAPGFLADLNMNKLDIWSNGIKVGRIHLCLVNDINNMTLLLLDCVDGTERIIASKKKFELILAAVASYAKWLGINLIKVNYDIDFNMTPKKFIRQVMQLLQGQEKLDFLSRFLQASTSRQLIPYGCQTFLESFIKSNGAFVRGAFIKIETNDQ